MLSIQRHSPSAVCAGHHGLVVVVLLVTSLAERTIFPLDPRLTAAPAERPLARLCVAAGDARGTATLALQAGAAEPVGAGGPVPLTDRQAGDVVGEAAPGTAPGVLGGCEAATDVTADTLTAQPPLRLLLSGGQRPAVRHTEVVEGLTAAGAVEKFCLPRTAAHPAQVLPGQLVSEDGQSLLPVGGGPELHSHPALAGGQPGTVHGQSLYRFGRRFLQLKLS